MTEIVSQSASHIPSSPRQNPSNDVPNQQPLFSSFFSLDVYKKTREKNNTNNASVITRTREEQEEEEEEQLSVLEAVVTVLRKSTFLISCSSSDIKRVDCCNMEIGFPTDVRHVAHVTFDRFNGFLGLPVEFEPDVPTRPPSARDFTFDRFNNFLGLPVEFEPEVPVRPPSASTRVFGVSTDSMQLSFDSRGNSVPTILLMMQRRLYEQGGLQAEGIFRITAGNSQEEYVREKLNNGVVPENIDVHCLAGLIKAWFRELPNGILDSIPAEDVMQAQTEEECARLVNRLPHTEGALLDWAINLMADVSQLESYNKMNARNIAMVFAPNMTQMADPLTALMYAVQVMNFLKTLIEKTLRERADSILEHSSQAQAGPYDDNGHQTYPQPVLESINEANEDEQIFLANEPSVQSPSHNVTDDSKTESEAHSFLTSIENIIPEEKACLDANEALIDMLEESGYNRSNKGSRKKKKNGQTSISNFKRVPKKVSEEAVIRSGTGVEKSKGTSIISRLNSSTERVEAWR